MLIDPTVFLSVAVEYDTNLTWVNTVTVLQNICKQADCTHPARKVRQACMTLHSLYCDDVLLTPSLRMKR